MLGLILCKMILGEEGCDNFEKDFIFPFSSLAIDAERTEELHVANLMTMLIRNTWYPDAEKVKSHAWFHSNGYVVYIDNYFQMD